MNRAADAGDAGRVRHRQVVACAQGVLVVQLDLAAGVHRERAVGRVEHARALDRVDGGGQPRPVARIGGLDDEVADGVVADDLNEVDGPDRPAHFTDRARDLAEHARVVRDLDPEREAVLGAGGCRHVAR